MKLKYPGLTLFVMGIFLAYLFFRNNQVQDFVLSLGTYSYIGIFLAGILFAFGFTSPFAAGFFIILHPTNIYQLLIFGIVGGLGALSSDLFIFEFTKISLKEEFAQLKKTKLLKKIKKGVDKRIKPRVKRYILLIIAMIFIASPLPDEIGVTMLSGMTRISMRKISILGFTLNTLGIIFFLWI